MENLLIDLRTVFKLVNELRNEPVAVFQGNLQVNVFKAPLEGFLDFNLVSRIVGIIHLHFLLHYLEAAFQLIEGGIERILLLDLLAQAVRHHLRKAVGLVDGDIADTGHILDGALRRHSAESDHAGHVVCVVNPLHILVGGREVLEIHVDIRHTDTVRIEETLKQELVLDRVQIGNPEAISHNRTRRRTSSRPDQITHLARGADVILNNQEVIREAHLADSHQLELDTRGLLLVELVAIADGRTLISQVAQIGNRVAELVATISLFNHLPCLILAYRILALLNDVGIFLQILADIGHKLLVDIILREHVRAVNLKRLNLRDDLEGVGNGLGVVREELKHLLLALEILLLGVSEPFRIID